MGDEGFKGRTTAGVAGAAGQTGATGAQGSAGMQGNTGVVGIVGQWTSYRNFNFAYGDARIQDADAAKSADIAAYLKANPSLAIGLDGSWDANGSDAKDADLRDRRVESVRLSLVEAGVSNDRIKIGAFGEAKNRHDRRVEVLFATAN